MEFVLLALVDLFEPLFCEVTQLIAHLLPHEQLLLSLVLSHQLLLVGVLAQLLHQHGCLLLLLEGFLNLLQPLIFVQLALLLESVG